MTWYLEPYLLPIRGKALYLAVFSKYMPKLDPPLYLYEAISSFSKFLASELYGFIHEPMVRSSSQSESFAPKQCHVGTHNDKINILNV